MILRTSRAIIAVSDTEAGFDCWCLQVCLIRFPRNVHCGISTKISDHEYVFQNKKTINDCR